MRTSSSGVGWEGRPRAVAAHLGCTDRSVRRYLADLHERAQAAGVVEARHGLVLAMPPSEATVGTKASFGEAA